MNKSKLKSYAPAARREFIQAVTDRAHYYGLSENKNEIQPVEEKGDVAIIGGRAFPLKIASQRKNLEQRIEREGFAQVMEAVAYTWFNRFLALRYMEIHGYLEHGFRVLSNPSGSTIPEILEQAAHVQLPGLDQKKVVELKLDGSKDAELYRMILVAQCNALNTAMPFLFERIADETELLLPDNLLHSNSLIRKLVTEIDEEDWQQVEIIGWLYQFYISEKKDQVIGKVVKPEDIPAATQLFTPNWIVKYMVQNSLGRMWLATYPNSSLKGKMEYYIEPAEQTEEVKAQLAAITPKELNPETITLLDPASGSGHILVEAYDLFKEIYLERGYRSRDIPRLILEKNLYGLDIDDRAAQMAGFALLMKARGDDRRILKENPPRLNVMAIQGSEGIDADNLADALLKEKTYSIVDGPSEEDNAPAFGTPSLLKRGKGELISPPLRGGDEGEGDFFDHANDPLSKKDIKDLLELFKHGKNFGSLIQIPDKIAGKLKALANLVESHINSPDIFTQKAANTLLPFVRQAMVLSGKYDCVVANPPYMGGKGMNPLLKDYAKVNFPDSKSDLFAMFVERGFGWCGTASYNAMVTMQSWMFLSSFETMRKRLLAKRTLITMAHLGARAFSEISGEVVQTTSFVFQGKHHKGFKPVFFRLVEGHEEQKKIALHSGHNRFDTTVQDDFQKIPSSPIAYWLTWSQVFDFPRLGDSHISGGRNKTHNNEKYLRFWWEITSGNSDWKIYANGGDFRKYYGNELQVVHWTYEAMNYYDSQGGLCNKKFWDREGITWSLITSATPSFRLKSKHLMYSSGAPTIFQNAGGNDNVDVIAFLNSPIAISLLKVINPTLNTTVGDVLSLPYKRDENTPIIERNTRECIKIAKLDWDAFEESLEFSRPLILTSDTDIESSWKVLANNQVSNLALSKSLEEENNRIFIEAYGLQDELSAEVPEDQITLARADRETDIKRLISYAVGCMMGRYSLDEPGLIYANSGNKDFWEIYNGQIPINPPLSKEENIPHFGKGGLWGIFKPDDDGIIPVMDMDWFEDDAASRFEEFLRVAWPDPSPQPSPNSRPDGAAARGEGALLEENMKFVADSLSPKAGETPRETIRRYFSAQFYKDHMQTYKKRPIYWLFSSGKQRAFECLVYLHRYNESTLSRMRNEYVTPLQGKFSARVEYLTNEKNAAISTATGTKLQKQLDSLKKKQVELAAFDDLLRHYADKRIHLALDDGVKVNYGKFGNLLAEVKVITGGIEE